MKFTMEAACGCSKGKIRKNNEDNFFFDGKFLDVTNDGMEAIETCQGALNKERYLAIFDGMGGEQYGEQASFSAAQAMARVKRSFGDFFISKTQYLRRLTEDINNAVVAAAKELRADRMGATLAALAFSEKYAYSCNLGDSRVYRLRAGEFTQLSQDHVSMYPRRVGRKAPLTQYLGIDPGEMLLEPYIIKEAVCSGDQYLLCSDGLTDMLTDSEISGILLNSADVRSCTEALIGAALDHGGYDNITVIVCRIY